MSGSDGGSGRDRREMILEEGRFCSGTSVQITYRSPVTAASVVPVYSRCKRTVDTVDRGYGPQITYAFLPFLRGRWGLGDLIEMSRRDVCTRRVL